MAEVRAVMTVPELAKLANVSRREMAKLLMAGGVRLFRMGRTRRVFLAEIRQRMPELWESLCSYQGAGL